MKAKHIFLTAALWCALSGVASSAAIDPTPLLTRTAPDQLLAVLQSGSTSRKDKADACRELAVVGTSQAVPVLVRLLADPELHHMARYALETIPGPGVDEALRGELPKLKGRSLIGVIGSLGVRKDVAAVKPVTPLLDDSDPQVAQAAARALGAIGTPDAARALEAALPKTAPANQLAFCEGLFRCAESFAANGKAKDALALYDQLRARTEAPPQVRAGALRGAIVAQGPDGLGLLKESLAGTDPVLFAAAVRAALEMPGPEVTAALAAILPQIPPEPRIVVLQALGSRGDDRAIRALAAETRAGALSTRVAALRAVAAIGSTSSVPVLSEWIGAPETELAQAALDGLAGIPGAEADAEVLNLAKSPKADHRLAGVDLIGRRRMAEAVAVLLRAATDSDAKVRASAYQRLGKLGTLTQLPDVLALLLRATEPRDLEGLAEALSAIGTGAGSAAAAARPIIRAKAGARPAQQAALIGVLGDIGSEPALMAVRGAARDDDPEIRDAGIRALAGWPDATAMLDLVQVIGQAPIGAQRDLAFRGYVRLARESGGTPAEQLKSLSIAATLAASPPEKLLVFAGLGDLATVESLRLVVPHLTDPAVADAAGAAVVKIAEKLDAKDADDLGPALNQVLKSAKSPPVVDQARKRLEQLKLPVQ